MMNFVKTLHTQLIQSYVTYKSVYNQLHLLLLKPIELYLMTHFIF